MLVQPVAARGRGSARERPVPVRDLAPPGQMRERALKRIRQDGERLNTLRKKRCRTEANLRGEFTRERLVKELRRNPHVSEGIGGYYHDLMARHARTLDKELREHRNLSEVRGWFDDLMREVAGPGLPGGRWTEGEEQTEGDRRVSSFLWVLNHLGVRWSDKQRLFLWWFLQAVLPHFYGDTFDAEAGKVCHRFGLDRVRPFACVMAPRRVGKTWCLAGFLVSYVLVCPGKTVAVFSATERSGKWVLEKILSFMEQLPGDHRRRVVRLTKTEMWVHRKKLPEGQTMNGPVAARMRAERDEVTIVRVCPATVAGTRGIDADLMVLEEAGFVPSRVFYSVIAPVLGIANSALVAITTPPDDGEHYFSKMENIVDADGERIFHYVKEAVACDDCVNEGRGMECPHKPNALPSWRTGKRSELLKWILGAEVFLQEGGGVQVGQGKSAFPREIMNALVTRDRVVVPPDTAPVVIVAIDPAAGGRSSEFAILSLLATKSTLVVSRGTPGATSAPGRERGRAGRGRRGRPAC